MSESRTKLSLPLWTERYAAPLAPASAAEMAARGWDYVDVVFVTGDAYVDHPSFAMAILHRALEAAGQQGRPGRLRHGRGPDRRDRAAAGRREDGERPAGLAGGGVCAGGEGGGVCR